MRTRFHRVPPRRRSPGPARARGSDPAADRPGARATRLFAIAAVPTAIATTAIGGGLAQVDATSMGQAVRAWQDWWLQWSGWTVGLAALSAGTAAGLYGLAVRASTDDAPDPELEVDPPADDEASSSANVVWLDVERARRRASRPEREAG